jgi:hypothetical protein
MERLNTVDYMYGEPSKYHQHNAFIDPEDHTRQTPILDQQEYYQPFKSLTASLTLQADKEDSLSDYDTIISGERGVSIFTAFQSTQPCHVRYHYYQEGLFGSWYILALILGSFTLMMLSLLDRICDDFSIDIMKKPFEHTTKSTYFTTGTSLKKATKSSNHVLNVYSCNEAGITDGRSDVYGIKQAYFVFFDRFRLTLFGSLADYRSTSIRLRDASCRRRIAPNVQEPSTCTGSTLVLVPVVQVDARACTINRRAPL